MSSNYAIEAEKSLCGAMLRDNTVIDIARGELLESDFMEPNARKVFTLACLCRDAGEPFTPERAARSRQPVPVAFLAELVGFGLPSSANAYTGEIKRFSAMRQIEGIRRVFANRVDDEATSPNPDPESLMSWMQAQLDGVAAACGKVKAKTIGECAKTSLQRIAEAMASQSQLGLPTGFDSVDDVVGGLFPGELTTIAARPGIGKTSLAIQMCRNIAEQGKRAVVFSLEMTGTELATRNLCSIAEISNQKIRSGATSANDFAKLQYAADQVGELDMLIDDRSSVTVHQIAAMCKLLAAEKPISVIAVDYIGLVQPSTNVRARSRREQIGEVTGGLKALAKDLDCPVLALSQVNREADKEGWIKLRHLSESGSIEQDSNSVWFIQKDDKGGICFDVQKNRNGQTGQIQMGWDPQFTRFRDCTPSEMDNYESGFSEYGS